MEGIHEGWIHKFSKGGRGPGRWKSPSRVQGQSLDRGSGARPLEAEAKCDIIVQFLTFSCKKLGLNE